VICGRKGEMLSGRLQRNAKKGGGVPALPSLLAWESGRFQQDFWGTVAAPWDAALRSSK
jgi:hypothetical protein